MIIELVQQIVILLLRENIYTQSDVFRKNVADYEALFRNDCIVKGRYDLRLKVPSAVV